MSIGRSQAEALAEGLLDNLGTDSGELQPRETFSELILIVGEFIEDAQKNLISSNSIASGSLSGSLVANDPVKEGNIVKVDIEMNFYGQFVNKGVKGTKSGQGLYQFKSAFPSKDMVKALMAGVNRAKASTTNVNRNRTVSRNERKNVNISDISKAYGAGRNIKMYGIKATGFIDKALTKAEQKIEDRLSAALRADIINSLPDGDNNTSISS